MFQLRHFTHSLIPITRTTNTQTQVRLHYADGRMPVDVAVSLTVSEMKRFTVGTLLSKISQLFPSTSDDEQRAVVEYSNSGTFINSVLNDPSLRLRTNDLARPIDVWCFQDFNEKKNEEEKESCKDQHGSTFQNDQKVQINIQGKRVLYVGASVRDLSFIFCFCCRKYSEITLNYNHSNHRYMQDTQETESTIPQQSVRFKMTRLS